MERSNSQNEDVARLQPEGLARVFHDADLPHSRMLQDMSMAVIAAGEEIQRLKDEDAFEVYTKAGAKVTRKQAKAMLATHLMTDADLKSHEVIAAVLGEESYNGVPLIYEEGQQKPNGLSTYIAVDELDGTGPYILGDSGHMVLSHFVEDGEIKLSANYDPTRQRLYYALKGIGSFVNGERLELRNHQVPLQEARVIVNGRDRDRAENRAYYQHMEVLFKERLQAGMATGSRIAGILEGEIDAHINAGSERPKVWDRGMLLNLEEAGGVVSQKDGTRIDPKDTEPLAGLVCSRDPALQKIMVGIVRRFESAA